MRVCEACWWVAVRAERVVMMCGGMCVRVDLHLPRKLAPWSKCHTTGRGGKTLNSGTGRRFCAADRRDNRHVRSNLHVKSFLSRGWMPNTLEQAGGRPLWACFAGCKALADSYGGRAAELRSALCAATWREPVRAIGPGSPWPWTPVDARLTCGVASSWSWPQPAMILTEAWTIASKSKTWGAKMGAEHAMTWTDAPHTGLHTYRFH